MERLAHPLTNSNVGRTRGTVHTEDDTYDYSHQQYIRSMWPGETEDVKSLDNRYIADYDKEGVRHQNSGLTKEIADGYQLENRSRNWLVIDIDEGMPEKPQSYAEEMTNYQLRSRFGEMMAKAHGFVSDIELQELTHEQEERKRLELI